MTSLVRDVSRAFARTGGNYTLLFAQGACAVIAALGVDLVMGILERPVDRAYHRS